LQYNNILTKASENKNRAFSQNLFDFLFADLLEGYEKLCAAAAHVTPALVDLEVEHLRRFSLTW
jgi:hypothetical protein